MSNYATKYDLKNATCVNTSDFAKKIHLATLKSNFVKLDSDKLEKVTIYLSSLKSVVDKLDIDKLETSPVDLSKLNDVVKNNIVKKKNMMNCLKRFMPLIQANLLKKQIIILRSKILK